MLPRNVNRVTDLFDQDIGQWNSHAIHQWFEEDSSEAILNITSNNVDEEDKVVWVPNPKGKFSIKTAYNQDQEVRFTRGYPLEDAAGKSFGP